MFKITKLLKLHAEIEEMKKIMDSHLMTLNENVNIDRNNIKYINSEEFIDSVVERIKKKQLGGQYED